MNKEIKNKIKNSFNSCDLPEFETIFKNCEQKKGMMIMEKRKLFKNYAMAIFVFVIVGLFGFNYYNTNKKMDTKISIDVNPSVELLINKKNKVLEVTAKNEEANIIIDNMNLKGSDLDVAMNALLGSMLKNGYISDVANSILISVENKDTNKSETIREELVNSINNYLNNTIDTSILSQIVEENKYKELSEQYGISTGKVKLIESILANNQNYQFEDLVSLSINDLNLIFENQITIKVEGTPSQKGYIGKDKAKEIALNHANVNPGYVEVELDFDKIVVYEVEFTYNNVEYDYEINAINGEIVQHKIDKDSTVTITITKEKAKQIALNHANVKEADIKNLQIELDDDIYEVEFIYNNIEYDYEINAVSGEIKNYKNSQNYITKDKAKEIALSHANVKEADIKNLKVELDDEIYEVEFIYNNMEYEYEISAITEKIIEYKTEKNS